MTSDRSYFVNEIFAFISTISLEQWLFQFVVIQGLTEVNKCLIIFYMQLHVRISTHTHKPIQTLLYRPTFV